MRVGEPVADSEPVTCIIPGHDPLVMERYPEFLPLCTGLRVLRRTRSEDGKEVVIAEMSVGYRAIRESLNLR